MLPNDTSRPAADGAPGASASPDPLNAGASSPGPTGLVDQPVLVPVLPPSVERRRGFPFAISLVLVAVMAGGALFLSGYQMGRDAAAAPGTAASEVDAWKPFWNVYDAITQRYPLDPVDRTTLIEGAIKGLVESVGDPYSSYLSPQDYTTTLDDISGTFEGIGAEIGSVDAGGNTSDCSTYGPTCFLVVIAPIEGSPAEKAGLRPGDLVIAADGAGFDGLTVDGALDRVRGPKGTRVALTVRRGEDDPFVLEITRDVIQQREVRSELLEGNIGYIRLAGFSDASAAQLEDEIRKHLDAGSKKLILDLRGNPGGYVTAARDIASEFIADGVLFYEEDATGDQVETDAVPGGIATDPSISLVVLIDEGSASASEIVAGALQDRGRATLVGTTSFGKGTVQQWQELPGEGGAFRLTIARWLTPNKTWIHDTGISPDVAVTVPEDPPPDTDPILDRALEVMSGTSLRHVLRAAA